MVTRSRNLHVSRIFQVGAPVNCACLHPNQAELFVGDQAGVIHIWDVKTEHNEQLVGLKQYQSNSHKKLFKLEFVLDILIVTNNLPSNTSSDSRTRCHNTKYNY